MMGTYCLSSEFWMNTAWLTVGALVVALFVRLLFVVYCRIKGEGVFPYVVGIMVLLPLAGYGIPAILSWVTSPELGKWAFVGLDTKDRKHGPISIFAHERVSLFAHYMELLRLQRNCHIYRSHLIEEKNAMTSQQGQEALSSEIRTTEEDISKLENMLRHIEDLAGRVYFARFMANLGAPVDHRELDDAVDHMVVESSSLVNQNNMKR